VNFNGTTNVGGFCTIRSSFNVTSVADNGTGDYTINFTNALPDVNYATNVYAYSTSLASLLMSRLGYAGTTTSIRIGIYSATPTALDVDFVNAAIFR
jgi:hypothetical protein